MVGMIDRKSSIESEPRTLGFHQINHAREEALYVLRTRNEEDALRIFTEGLELAGQRGEDTCEKVSPEVKERWYAGEECDGRQLHFTTGGRDILTAPF